MRLSTPLQRFFTSPDNEAGSALIELALVVGCLGIPLLLGTGEFGPIVYDSAEVQNAAHAAALYGAQSSTFALDIPGMIGAAQTEASEFGTSLQVTPFTYFVCSNAIAGAKYGTLAPAQTACTGTDTHPLQMIQVSTSLRVTPAVQCPGLASSITVTGSSVMEVQQ